MSHIYIANASPRPYRLHYRLPEMPTVPYKDIPAGQQIALKDLAPEAVDFVIKQLNAAGAVDIKRLGEDKFVGLIYTTRAKPVDVDGIEEGLSVLDEQAIERAIEARTNNAIAADNNMGELARQTGGSLEGSEISMIEQPSGAHDSGPKVEQTIEVVRDGRKGLSGGKKGNRRA